MTYTRLRTLRQLSAANPAFSVGGLRWMVFHAASNGLADARAIVRVGRRVLIDEDRFGDWLAAHASPRDRRRA